MIRAALRTCVLLGATALLTTAANAKDSDSDLMTRASETVGQYQATDPGLTHVLKHAAGYAVLPSIAKGGFVVGGAAGDGVVFSGGRAIGRVNLSQVTFGAQIGGQTYSELIVFKDQTALDQLKTSDFTFSAQVSAVALQSGVSENAKYTNGVLVITATKSGLMAEATVGGQKFHFEPFAKPVPTG